MNWISTKHRRPEPFQLVVLSIVVKGKRQYHTDYPWPYQLKNGTFIYGSCRVDFWMPLEPIVNS